MPNSIDRRTGATRRDVRRLIVLASLVVVLTVAGAGALLAFASGAVNRLQAREERTMVEATLHRFKEIVVSDLTTASVWDQAYARLRPGVSLDWADAEIGTYYVQNRNHDFSVVLDPHDRPFYVFRKSGRAAPDAVAGELEDLRPVLTEFRRLERTAGRHPGARGPTDAGVATTLKTVALLRGVPHLVGAASVAPETWNGPPRPGPGAVVISAQRLDGPLLNAVGNVLQIQQPRVMLGTAEHQPAAPLIDMTGRRIGSVVWEPRSPGLKVIREAAPYLLAGAFALLSAAIALGLGIRRVVHKLRRNEEELVGSFRALVAARDQAEAANRAKSDFLANISHEIRTPLNGVLGMAHVMARDDLSQTQRERLGVIRNSGQGLLTLLNDLLDLAKIEASRLELENVEFDLAEVVSAACDPFGPIAQAKDVDLVVTLDPGASGVWLGDCARLRQVISNLVSNAVKFTAEGEVRVTAAAGRDGDPCALRITVADTGAGIEADHVRRLFEKFSQLDSSATREFAGSGLGLAISRELARLMGGDIGVSSRKGEGSEFTLEVPLQRLRSAAARADAASASDAPSGGEPGERLVRVLAAEDNVTNQLVLRAMLEPLNVELEVAPNGLEALEAWRRGAFDLILMDMQMPVMDGMTATQRIREVEAAEQRPRTPIIALTANVMTHQVEAYTRCGVDACVAKPIDGASLYRALSACLAEREADAAAAA